MLDEHGLRRRRADEIRGPILAAIRGDQRASGAGYQSRKLAQGARECPRGDCAWRCRWRQGDTHSMWSSVFITRAGFPTATAFVGTDFVTTLPAPNDASLADSHAFQNGDVSAEPAAVSNARGLSH